MNKREREKKERNKKDKEWREAVKERDGNKCVRCSSTERTNVHHIIPREIKEFRWNTNNGICLCPRHHRFSRELSAHQNPLAFFMWMEEHKPNQLNYLKNCLEEYEGKDL